MKWPMYISLMPATLMVRCEPFGDYRAIVDQYLWLVCFAVA